MSTENATLDHPKTDLDIADLQERFHAFVKMKPGPERQRAILAWLEGSNEPGACNKIPVNGRMQLTTRDPDLASLLKRGIIVAQQIGGKAGKYAKFGPKGQTFLALA